MTVQQFDVLEASARLEFNGVEDVVGVYQFQKTDPIPTDDQDAVDDVLSILDALYTALVSVYTVLMIARDIRVSNKTQSVVYGAFPWPSFAGGTAVADATPPGVAMLGNFSTGVARVTPRKYLGVFTDGNIDADGTWALALVISVAALFGGLLVPQVEANGTYSYGYLSPKTAQFEASIAVTVTDIPAYQRRRRQGRGS